jgi:hypothetical protein
MEERMSESAPETAPNATESNSPEAEAPDTEALGDAGKKALDAMKSKWKSAEANAAELQKQLDAINQANETALEKAQRELTAAQAAAEQATTEALRLRVAAKHGISDEDADLFLTGSDLETVEKQAAALAARSNPSGGQPGPRPDLSQGGTGTPVPGTPEQDFANFIGQQLAGR